MAACRLARLLDLRDRPQPCRENPHPGAPTLQHIDTLAFTRDTTYRTYDASGNVEVGWKRSWRSNPLKVQTRSYWDADGRLRAQEEYHETNGTPYLLHERRGYFSEYRYDALGRRVMVRTRRDGLCHKGNNVIADCTGGITRYVWSGDNLLWEMRGPGADSTFPGNLDDISDSRAEFGVVGYTHAGGVDRPLVVWKGIGSSPSVVVVPHMNWRGLFGRGTNSSGGSTTVAIEWPGFQTTAYHAYGPSQETTTNWMGSLLEGQRDPGGTMYMRNRYYDPATGQFTQTDPIGIAGGLNTYGFAAGEPVNFTDPFGLCPWWMRVSRGRCAAFDKLRPAEQRWVLNNLSAARVAAREQRATYEDLAVLGGFYERYTGSTHNTPIDAMRHAILSCRLTVTLGADRAKEVTDAHEGPHQDGSTDPEEETQMDQHNNRVGRALAPRAGGNPDSCAYLAHNADRRGVLAVINNNNISPTAPAEQQQ